MYFITQSDLSAIILKWRTHRIGFMADIEKCYRQILVHRDDVDMQRIIWTDKAGLPVTYRLLTVTYGLNCSPYVTIKVLHTLADDEEADIPQAAKVLRESFYMDDCLHGTDSVETAQQLQTELQQLLQRGGFMLRKWNSNSEEFLQGINMTEKLSDSCCELNLDRETKALGIYWFCQSDCIGYKVNVTTVSSAITKRQQLSDVAKIYDPTCLLAPVVITGKITCQQLWCCGISWDDQLPEPHQKNWVKFREELPLIDHIKVPRWVFSSPNALSCQLHVFSDASTSAYAAVAYLRVQTFDGDIKVSILMAKTKVAPLKKITVPCLELNGALLASKLAFKVLETLPLTSITLYCWSDSKTTLSWIRSNPGQHKQYVAN
ncbi:uncharacterized protein LOC129919178 [Episyrphus balteatus]|uniref:uncharacterized protein LOC129919178 n=1 Tax=Episyrphus balteatus TaxID=286459 RepID=UPI002485569F|nr:uncharacterized protein LOC129919178 [Episyrphus balteatus]